MARRKTTKKQPVEPVIEYVDPETNLEAEVDKCPDVARPLTTFDVLQRRMERESAK